MLDVRAYRMRDRRSETGATDIRVRDAAEVDLAAIAHIYNVAIATRSATAQLEPVTAEDCGAWLSSGYSLWVADIEGRVAGWLSCKPFLPRCAYRGTVELSVYVDENFRRRGVARQLLQYGISCGPLLGISAMVGLIFGDNAASLRLFERLGFARWGLLPRVARVDDIERNLVIMGRHCETPHTHATVNRSDAQLHAVFELMHTLMQYRQQPIHGELDRIRKKHSMLHLDVLLLIYHFASTCPGQILEIGACLGGATIAAARGVRDSSEWKTLIAVEQGGSLEHEYLGTRNILRDLERNLAKSRVSDLVTLIKGRSCDPATVAAVHQALIGKPGRQLQLRQGKVRLARIARDQQWIMHLAQKTSSLPRCDRAITNNAGQSDKRGHLGAARSQSIHHRTISRK